MATLRGFICYARDDHKRVATLHKHLRGLGRDYDIEFWRDPDIKGGSDWNDDIRNAIDAAQVFLLVISPAWRASDFIENEEVPRIAARARDNGGLVIPVILERCPWERDAGNLDAVPRDARDVKPIAEWKPEGNGHEAAAAAVRTAIQAHFNRAPRKRQWAVPVSRAQQDPAGDWWIVAGRQLDVDPKGDRTDAAAASDRVTRELHDAVRERATALAEATKRLSNDPDWPDLTTLAAGFAADVAGATETVGDRIVPVWNRYTALAVALDLHRIRKDAGYMALAEEIALALRSLIQVAAPFMHQFPTVRGFEAASGTLTVTDPLAKAAESVLARAQQHRLIPDNIATDLTERLRRPNTAANAVLGVRNLLVKMGGVYAAFALGRWKPVGSDEQTLLTGVLTVLSGARLDGAAVMAGSPNDLVLAFGAMMTDAASVPPVPLVLPAVAAVRRDPRPGDTERDGPDYPEMVLIPAGSYMRGVPEEEEQREGAYDSVARPVHRVTIPAPIWIGRYPVTRGEFAVFAADTKRKMPNKAWTYEPDEKGKWNYAERSGRNWLNPGFPQTDRDPVVCVSHRDAVAYTKWLSRRTGKTYRLPSEAEWEYAARAGTDTPWYWGNKRDAAFAYANVADGTLIDRMGVAFDKDRFFDCEDGFAFTAPVGSFAPNGFGLFDVLGNVWEWCADRWHDNYNGAPDDGSEWTTGGDPGRCVLRGGSWYGNPGYVRAGVRYYDGRGVRNGNVGFRLSRTLSAPTS